MLKKLLYLCLFLFSPALHAQYYDGAYSKYQRFSVDVQYSTYDDILNSTVNDVLELDSAININANFRFYRTFSLVFSHGTADTWNYNGIGFRVDLPGIYFIGGTPNDFVRKAKKKNVNTYMQFSKLITHASDVTDKFVCDKMGFGLDVFIYSGLYFNAELNLFSYRGNQFISPTIGVGFEF